jgi:hypothetical protein
VVVKCQFRTPCCCRGSYLAVRVNFCGGCFICQWELCPPCLVLNDVAAACTKQLISAHLTRAVAYVSADWNWLQRPALCSYQSSERLAAATCVCSCCCCAAADSSLAAHADRFAKKTAAAARRLQQCSLAMINSSRTAPDRDSARRVSE